MTPHDYSGNKSYKKILPSLLFRSLQPGTHNLSGHIMTIFYSPTLVAQQKRKKNR